MKKILILFFIVLIILSIYNQINARKNGRKYFKDFNTANINGVIDKVDVYDKLTTFSLKDGNQFIFSPYVDKADYNGNNDENYKIFLSFAKNGDSVVKPAYSEKLYLYRDGRKYIYRFTIIE